ncbi:hypothetical protein [Pseudoalteromonas byunsanensis]|uniref:Uncharacterized protein n=1 Tax=Pseudoalteromonas byunsanensis TaxID=327939 RepID=A0A1S1N0Z8_9GAMM|nr:hypothetical protein [Pseudoalteromonas byunsanensis]OHU93669.1 hypothetical protein BIW53_20250 [Pseudoalteromonas byunsanensis]
MKLHALTQHSIAQTALDLRNQAGEGVRTLNLSNNIQKAFTRSQSDDKAAMKKELPAHIDALLAQQKKIKKQLREQKEQLVDVKTRLDMNEEIRQNMIKHLTAELTQLHLQLVSISQALHDALKKSGISDLNQLVDVLS